MFFPPVGNNFFAGCAPSVPARTAIRAVHTRSERSTATRALARRLLLLLHRPYERGSTSIVASALQLSRTGVRRAQSQPEPRQPEQRQGGDADSPVWTRTSSGKSPVPAAAPHTPAAMRMSSRRRKHARPAARVARRAANVPGPAACRLWIVTSIKWPHRTDQRAACRAADARRLRPATGEATCTILSDAILLDTAR